MNSQWQPSCYHGTVHHIRLSSSSTRWISGSVFCILQLSWVDYNSVLFNRTKLNVILNFVHRCLFSEINTRRYFHFRGGEVRPDPVVGTNVDSFITRSFANIGFISNDDRIFDCKYSRPDVSDRLLLTLRSVYYYSIVMSLCLSTVFITQCRPHGRSENISSKRF